MGRVSTIVQRVADGIGDPGNQSVNRTRILTELQNVQQDICRKYLVLKGQTQLVLLVGTKIYSVQGGLFKIEQIVEPSTWTRALEIVSDRSVWRDKVRETYGIACAQPLFATVWNGYLNVTPAPTVAGEVLELFYYGGPQESLVLDGDPEVSEVWDDALTYGTLERIVRMNRKKLGLAAADADDWKRQYVEEAGQRAMEQVKETTQEVKRVRHSSDVLGF